MPETILNAIFKGNILPWESKAIKTPKFKELERNISLEHDHFEEPMSTHEKGRFDQYHCLLNERVSIEIRTSEFELFMLGINVGMEIMEHKQAILEEETNVR